MRRAFLVVVLALVAILASGMVIDNPTITKIANLTTNGIVTTSGSDGTLGVSTNTYRVALTGNRTYYVRTDGNDSNTGLVNTAGGAFLTIQHAVDVVSMLDLSIYVATVQVADGTYTGAVSIANLIGSTGSKLTIQGNSGTPANVLISTTGVDAFHIVKGAVLIEIKDLKITTTTDGYCIYTDGAFVNFSNLVFGTSATSDVAVYNFGLVVVTGNFTIAGNAVRHATVGIHGHYDITNLTITLTGTPAFSDAFIAASVLASVRALSDTFSGSATGVRYKVDTNGVIDTGGGGANYFPGDSAGTTSTGGQYN